jgi:glucuronosyltransferase
MPPHIVEMFVRVFARIPQRVFWKWENDSKIQRKLTDNIMMVNWLPQQDLLGIE